MNEGFFRADELVDEETTSRVDSANERIDDVNKRTDDLNADTNRRIDDLIGRINSRKDASDASGGESGPEEEEAGG